MRTWQEDLLSAAERECPQNELPGRAADATEIPKAGSGLGTKSIGTMLNFASSHDCLSLGEIRSSDLKTHGLAEPVPMVVCGPWMSAGKRALYVSRARIA